MKVTYHGWSSVIIEFGGHTIAMDPFYNNLYGTRWSTLADYTGVDLLLLSHGHNEHFIDAAKIIDKTGAHVVAPRELTDHLAQVEAIAPSLLHPMAAYQAEAFEDVHIRALPFRHRLVSPSRYLTGNSEIGMRFVTANALLAPKTTTFLGYALSDNAGKVIVCLSEGINPMYPDEELLRVKELYPAIDLLIGGAQLSFSQAAAHIVAVLAPKTCLMYHPHEALFHAMELESEPPEAFVSACRKQAPETETIYMTPGFSRDFS